MNGNVGPSSVDEALRKALIAKGVLTQDEIDKQEPPARPSDFGGAV